MNLEHLKTRLLARRQELETSIARSGDEARTASEAEVGDNADRSRDDAAADEALQLGSADSETLAEVNDALRRMEDGSYGQCANCGKQIEPARLEAIPWTPYCMADRQKLEKGSAPAPTL